MTIKIHPRYTKELIGHNREKKLFGLDAPKSIFIRKL